MTITIDPESGMPATPQCPMQSPEVFIAGTEPVGTCPLHGGKGDHTTVSGWDMPPPRQPQTPQPRSHALHAHLPPRRDNAESAPRDRRLPQNQPRRPPDKQKKKGFFGKLKDVFR